MKRNLVLTVGLALLGSCAVLVGLGLTGRANVLPKGQGLPEKDIVFTPEDASDSLGFINADGTGFETRTLEISEGFLRDLARLSTLSPSGWITWGPDGRSLAGSIGRYYTGAGVPFVITADGSLQFCPDGDDSTPFSSARSWIVGGSTILTIDEYPSEDPDRVLLMNMATCIVQEVLYEQGPNEGIEEAALSSDGWLAIAVGRRDPLTGETSRWIALIDPQGAEVAAVADGRWPAWSRDGEWLVYTVNEDGLHIVRKEGTEDRKVLDAPKVGPASWSPDGQWLAYDRPTGEGNQAIYKVNLTSGEEVEIFKFRAGGKC